MANFLEKIKILGRVIPDISKAAPQNVEWTGYKSQEMNDKMYDRMAGDKRKVLIETLAPATFLYRLPDKLVVLDESNRRLLYLVQFGFSLVFSKKGVTQTKVWRDKSSPLTKGLAERIFFHYLFPMADCIVTDKQQTSYGRAFWELRIYEAFAKSLPVYLLDHNPGTKQLLASSLEFDQLLDTWWGDEPKFQRRTIAICHKKFW